MDRKKIIIVVLALFFVLCGDFIINTGWSIMRTQTEATITQVIPKGMYTGGRKGTRYQQDITFKYKDSKGNEIEATEVNYTSKNLRQEGETLTIYVNEDNTKQYVLKR